MSIGICSACIKDSIPEDVQILATAEGVWTGQFECHVCGRISVYTFSLPVSLPRKSSEQERIDAVVKFLREDCSEQQWKEINMEHYIGHILKYIPFLRKNYIADRIHRKGLYFERSL